MDLLEEKGSILVATFSITRDITLTKEDFDNIKPLNQLICCLILSKRIQINKNNLPY